jgi:hypothetical protein
MRHTRYAGRLLVQKETDGSVSDKSPVCSLYQIGTGCLPGAWIRKIKRLC